MKATVRAVVAKSYLGRVAPQEDQLFDFAARRGRGLSDEELGKLEAAVWRKAAELRAAALREAGGILADSDEAELAYRQQAQQRRGQ